LRLQLAEPSVRQGWWEQALKPLLGEATRQASFAARAYPFGRDEIDSVVALAKIQASQRQRSEVTPSDVESACQVLAGQNMGELAQRVRVALGWDDVVLAKETQEVIDEMLTYGRFQHTVFQEHGYAAKMAYGQGLTALFWGPPGTGKTLISGLLARELGLELYKIELSQVVSKYIGETEQRLAQIFDEAVASGMALLFDEADALFAKRTEVKSSNDRYANLEVNFLLQRVEHHEGVVILTTNFPNSIDEAFMRRIRFKAEFPAPEAPERARLWKTMIPRGAPRERHIEFEELGEIYELTGGEIRNAVLRAAFYAAEERRPLGTSHLNRAAQHEYREAGRLLPGEAFEFD
ncbi:MAG: AAA family ATPase, partial [Myxococcales bacterium]|nr:AAA family ATPase [Myxococcales bacterium]